MNLKHKLFFMADISDPNLLKEVMITVSPVIKSLVDTFVTPNLLSLKKRFNLDYKKYHIPTESHFSEYFHRAYKKYCVLNTLVFNNSQRILKDIYIPLSISTNRGANGFKINSYPKGLLNKYEKILITDTAGMGKSTMMKRIFLDIIDEKIGVPILIELRRLSRNKTIIQEIHEQINSIDKEFDEQLLLEFIKEGGFIFILDGYDEIALEEREFVTSNIQDFVVKANNNKFLLTSRPESALSSFGDFQNFSIQPLRKKEAFDLLRKYDRQGSVSTLLIKKLGESHMSNIDEFLTNPLLVSLLFTSFQYKQAIPFKKYLFYRQVYDANFESHDLTKGDSFIHDKYTGLEVDDFHRVLRHIGFSCFKMDKIEFSKDEILGIIADSKKFCVGIDFKESDFLKDIIITVPLFLQDGNYYKWAHKSLQEYFAAQFIYLDIHENKNSFLKTLYNHKEFDRFINVLDLFYDMDYKSFRNIILFEYLKEYKFHYERVSYNDTFLIPSELIIERIGLCFGFKFLLFYTEKEYGPLDESFDGLIDKYISSSDNEYGIRFSFIEMGGVVDKLFFILLYEPHHYLKKIFMRKNHEMIKRYNYSRNFKDIESIDFSEFFDSPDKPTDITSTSLFCNEKYYELGNRIVISVLGNEGGIIAEKALAMLSEIEEDLSKEDCERSLLSI